MTSLLQKRLFLPVVRSGLCFLVRSWCETLLSDSPLIIPSLHVDEKLRSTTGIIHGYCSREQFPPGGVENLAKEEANCPASAIFAVTAWMGLAPRNRVKIVHQPRCNAHHPEIVKALDSPGGQCQTRQTNENVRICGEYTHYYDLHVGSLIMILIVPYLALSPRQNPGGEATPRVAFCWGSLP
ncbi:predicted protein [Histoplasma capsulatum H143]|uniref:Uncharacterized protein n=1 Tax=Ajellomyces capsulatus (strain H143) TaxID=544712 RepID=C6H1M8_AJECH|nr:predicted protein [Histoplasma capsulatum H143]